MLRKMCIRGMFFALCFLALPVWGADYYVDPDGNDLEAGTSWATAFETIQKALDTASSGDVIDVNEGTYYEAIDFNGLDCTLRSTDPNDWDVVAATIIDGNSAQQTIDFSSSEDANTLLIGLTIRNANKASGKYGIFTNGSTTVPSITKCIIEECAWGLRAHGGATVSDCIFRENTVAIYCVYDRDCTFQKIDY